MPKFYFNIRREDGLVSDEEGSEFADIAAAVEDAKASAREMIAEHIRMGDPAILDYAFEIVDESGALLRTLAFSEALHDDNGPVRTPPGIH